MDAMWKARWLEALRSGEYEQGQDALRSVDDKFCCLGVLTDICIKGTSDAPPWEAGKWYFASQGQNSYLPEWVAELTGVEFRGEIPDMPESLSKLNDRGVTFEEIANIIEEKF